MVNNQLEMSITRALIPFNPLALPGSTNTSPPGMGILLIGSTLLRIVHIYLCKYRLGDHYESEVQSELYSTQSALHFVWLGLWIE